MLRCRDIVKHADAYLSGEMPFWTRLGFRVHLLFCRYCRRYVRELRLTLEVSRRMAVAGPADDARIDELAALLCREEGGGDTGTHRPDGAARPAE